MDVAAELKELSATLASIEAVVNLDALRGEAAGLEKQASAPDLWDDVEQAQKITSRLSYVQGEVRRVEDLRRRLDDTQTLWDLAEEMDDADSRVEAESEIAGLRKAIGELEVRTLLSGEYDSREALMTIRAEAGGVDAADFAEMLLRMYTRWAERHGYSFDALDTSYAEEAGIKSATIQIHAPYAYGTLSVEQGTHRLVRISPFDNQGRRQTSFVGVEVLPVVEQSDHVEIPDDEIRVDVYRSSGPGGQGVNTTDSAVRITHLPTGIVVAMQDEKSQIQNRAKALQVLRARLLKAEQDRQAAEASDMRKSQVRTVDRSERIRTYNFPENRISDHRVNFKAYNLDQVLDGALDDVIDALTRADVEAALSGE